MAEIARPESDPRSLRRHYPHQVQGVVQLDLSAIAAPPHLAEAKSKFAIGKKKLSAHLRQGYGALKRYADRH